MMKSYIIKLSPPLPKKNDPTVREQNFHNMYTYTSIFTRDLAKFDILHFLNTFLSHN